MVPLAIVACSRPDYFRECIYSVMRNKEAKWWPIYVFVDHSNKQHEHRLILQDIMKEYAPRRLIATYQTKNLGIGRHMNYIRELMLWKRKEAALTILEDDVVVSKKFLSVTTTLNSWANDAVTTTWSMCHMPSKEKEHYKNFVTPTNAAWITYTIKQHAWKVIRKTMLTYEERFLQSAYAKRDNNAIRDFIKDIVKDSDYSEWVRKEMFFAPNMATSQDGIMVASLFANYLRKVGTVVNRCRYIGQIGTHGTRALYKSLGFHKVTLDEVEETYEFSYWRG